MRRPKKTRSIGKLRDNHKTKERSPAYTGRIVLLRETLEIIMRHLDERGPKEVEACLAAWTNRDRDGPYYTIELSPLYVKRRVRVHPDWDPDWPSDDEEDNDDWRADFERDEQHEPPSVDEFLR